MESTHAPTGSPQDAPAPAPGTAPAPGGHPGNPGAAAPARATDRQAARQAAPGTDALADFRQVFDENAGLERSLRDAMGVLGGDHELLQALETASSFFETHATDAQRQMLSNTGLSNDPQVLAFLHTTGKAFNTLQSDLQRLEVENARLRSQLDAPGTLRAVQGATSRGESVAMTNASIDESIELLWGEHGEALSDPTHRLHAVMSRKLERLQRARHGG